MAASSEQLCHQYSLVDIEIATQNFDERLIIGQGGFGKVYKGQIKTEQSSSTDVAIKRLDSMSYQGAAEFRAEIEMLSGLRHSHLVSLLGWCVDDEEMILVYKYIPNGTLYYHLHKSNTCLSWLQRLKISIGAARALDYLHTGADTQNGVIHRDIKCSNILLDEDYSAKISDFGLSKICPINQSLTYVNTGIKGTFGYLDPEVLMTGKFTRKTDVFAFGVVLFELLSGRHAVLPSGDDGISMPCWAQHCVKKRNLNHVVDAELSGKLSPKSLKEFSRIAYRCLHRNPKERPTMSEVVVALQRSLVLQEKFANCAKPEALSGFIWSMPSYCVSSIKTISVHGDQKFSKNREANISDRSSVLAQDGGDNNKVVLDNEKIRAQDLKIFSYTDLKCATRKFQIKLSSLGKHLVFKGWVHEKTYFPAELDIGLPIAVMQFKHTPKNLHMEKEIQLMGEYRHPNLQRLIGYCFEGEQFYLVHEFMEKRTLLDCLFEAGAELPIITRVKIAVEVTRALVFLHRKQMIVEGWVLAVRYIWLDKEFNAKLYYYDAARLISIDEDVFFPGSRQCDTKGLGMFLLEMLMGRTIVLDAHLNRVKREHFTCKVSEMSDRMIKNIVDFQIDIDAPDQTDRARELLSLVEVCIGDNACSMEQALDDLENFYKRITRPEWGVTYALN